MFESTACVAERDYGKEGSSSEYGPGESGNEEAEPLERRRRFQTALPVYDFNTAESTFVKGLRDFDFPYRQSVGCL